MTFWDWVHSWNLDWIAAKAPIVTATVAVLAFIAAIASIVVQRGLARRRAALDFFLKTETDEKLLNAYTSFNKALEKARQYKTGEELVAAEPQLYKDITDYLGIHELMALGVRQKIMSNRICCRFWANVLDAAVVQAGYIIDYVRRQPFCADTYGDLLELHKEWKRKGAC